MDELSNLANLVWLDLLPDTNQELFPQLLHAVDTFTYFPKLPLEIRNLIWEETFPGRRMINLDIGPVKNSTFSYHRLFRFHQFSPLESYFGPKSHLT